MVITNDMFIETPKKPTPCASVAFLFTLLLLGNSIFSNAQEYTHTQNRIKSIYIYNFIKDIQWPDGLPEKEITVCVIGQNDFVEELKKLSETKKVGDKKLNVITISSLSECLSCNLVFIEEASVGKLNRPENCKSLIITNGFYEKNISNIALMVIDNRLQFSINSLLCDKLGFKVSTHLSSLANQKIIQP
jgi:hypothetical protein